jgi:hypothetical protein
LFVHFGYRWTFHDLSRLKVGVPCGRSAGLQPALGARIDIQFRVFVHLGHHWFAHDLSRLKIGAPSDRLKLFDLLFTHHAEFVSDIAGLPRRKPIENRRSLRAERRFATGFGRSH